MTHHLGVLEGRGVKFATPLRPLPHLIPIGRLVPCGLVGRGVDVVRRARGRVLGALPRKAL